MCEKNGSQGTSQTAECVIRAVNTMCFERPDIRKFNGFGSPFGSLLGSLFHIVCKKCDPRPQKTGTKKTPQKLTLQEQQEKERMGYLRLTKTDQILISKYISPPKKNSHNFNIIGSIFFAFTISTTIGYG